MACETIGWVGLPVSFFYVFYVFFFKIKKSMTFYVFFELPHTFSRTLIPRFLPASYSSKFPLSFRIHSLSVPITETNRRYRLQCYTVLAGLHPRNTCKKIWHQSDGAGISQKGKFPFPPIPVDSIHIPIPIPIPNNFHRVLTSTAMLLRFVFRRLVTDISVQKWRATAH